ncbi:unnamed protein product [Moneuplotes crassus]|uniref:Purple acid phosphatase n=1 Tax=Euplotes crassus TaxID=5936 RepID=A0AAD1U5D6_EUPCR|nr:unnamed protein product [Moneuplotes crassus]
MLEGLFPSYQKRLTYKGYSFFINLVVLLVIIACFLIPTVILHLVQCVRLRKIKNQRLIRKEKPDEPDTDEDNMEELNELAEYSTFPSNNGQQRIHTSYEVLENPIGSNESWSFYIITIMILVTEILSAFSILGIVDLLLMYGYIHQTKSFMLWKYIVWISFLFLAYGRIIFACSRYEKTYLLLINKRFVCFAALAVIFLSYTTSVTIFTSGLCMASHSSLLEGFGIGRFVISTSFMRGMYPSTCSADSYPCMAYMTLPENSVNEAFINFHINQESCLDWECKPVLKYIEYDQRSSNTPWTRISPNIGEFSSLPSEYESRNIFTAYLKDLKPNMRYIFSISDEGAERYSEKFSFKTFDPNNFVILNGGDIGINPEAREMNNVGLANHRGDLMMIGGDISYDNNFPQCYRATDKILHEIPHSWKDSGSRYTNLIPMIKAPGNHDFGVNPNNHINIVHDQHEPLYKHYYTQNSFEQGVPPLSQRKSYFYHTIGSTAVIISLDSGYDTDLYGEQAEWLDSILNKHNDYPIKIVHYHEPIYPACEYAKDETQNLGKRYWVPIFDKYNVTIVFENHNHSLKRTFKLRDNGIDPNGVIYIGDGAWGAIDNPCRVKDNGFIAKYEAKNHVWEMAIDMSQEDQISLRAIGKNKEILDHIKLRV